MLTYEETNKLILDNIRNNNPNVVIKLCNGEIIKFNHDDLTDDAFVKHSNPYVRLIVARHCDEPDCLSKLVNDPNDNVRAIVASKGIRPDLFAKDQVHNVRVNVAKNGNCLDTLINDKHWRVREAVAKQGYGLDKLIEDITYSVVATVLKVMNNLNKLYTEYSDIFTNEFIASTDSITDMINKLASLICSYPHSNESFDVWTCEQNRYKDIIEKLNKIKTWEE